MDIPPLHIEIWLLLGISLIFLGFLVLIIFEDWKIWSRPMMLEVLNLLLSNGSFHMQDRVKCTVFKLGSCYRWNIASMGRCSIRFSSCSCLNRRGVIHWNMRIETHLGELRCWVLNWGHRTISLRRISSKGHCWMQLSIQKEIHRFLFFWGSLSCLIFLFLNLFMSRKWCWFPWSINFSFEQQRRWTLFKSAFYSRILNSIYWIIVLIVLLNLSCAANHLHLDSTFN